MPTYFDGMAEKDDDQLRKSLTLSIVVPLHNEAGNIAELCREVHAVLDRRHVFELVLVDDGSTDDTPRILSMLTRRHPRLRPVRHRRRCGQSAALRSGVVHAVHDSIITMDGDGQNDPRDIEGLLQTMQQAPRPEMTLVKGFRRSRRDSAWRRFSSLLANGVRMRLLGDATPDSGCGIQALSRELFLSLPWFDHMHRFLPALVLRAGGEVISREVNHRERSRGHSHYGTLDRLAAGLVDLAGVRWLMHRAPVPHIEEPHDSWSNRHLLAGDRFSGPGTVHGEIPGPMAAK